MERLAVIWCPEYVDVAFEQYVSQRLPSLRRFAHLLTGDWAEAEDLVQDVLVRCERRWRSIANDDPDAYVRRALVNAASNWRRGRRLETPLADDTTVPGHSHDVDTRELAKDAADRMGRALWET
jgi:DNA-directed RNA polymerase specialized sigma24 family protein